MRMTLQQKVGIGFIVAGLALVSILLIQFWYITGLLTDVEELQRTQQVKMHFDNLFSLVKDLERGHRGYLISGQVYYLEPYYSAKQDIPQEIQALEQLVVDPEQVGRLKVIQPLIDQELAFSSETIRLRNEGNVAAATELFAGGTGKKIVDQIRILSDETDQAQMELIAIRSARERHRARLALISFVGGVVLNLAVFGLLSYLIRREIRQRDAAEKALLES